MTAERVPAATTRSTRATAGMRRAAGAEDLGVPLPRDPAPRRARDRRDRDYRDGDYRDRDDRRDDPRGGRRDDPRRDDRRRDDERNGRRAGREERSRSGAAARTAVAERPGRSSASPKPASKPASAETSRSRMRVAPPEPVAAPRTPFVLLVLTLVAGGIVGLLVLNTAINADAFKITALKDQQTKLDTQEQQLNQELAELQSPGNLQAAATRLGLVPAGTPAYIHLPDGRILNVPQPAGASSSGR